MAETLPIWLTGSYPTYNGSGAANHIQAMLDLVPHPLVLGGGEWRKQEQDWIVPESRRINIQLTGNSTFTMEGKRYPDFAVRLAKGILQQSTVKSRVHEGVVPTLHYGDWALEDAGVVKTFRPISSGTGFMRGAPSPIGLGFFSGIVGHDELFERALATHITKLVQKYPKAIIQLEMPAELALLALTPGGGNKQKLLKWFTESLTRLIHASPRGTRFAFHLCWGDLGHRPFVPHNLQSLESLALLFNMLVGLPVWRAGWELAAIHVPFCDGKNPPPMNKNTFNVLRRLEAPSGSDFMMALGVLHAKHSTAQTQEVTGWLSEQLRRHGITQLALATPCGNARTPKSDLVKMYQTAHEVRI